MNWWTNELIYFIVTPPAASKGKEYISPKKENNNYNPKRYSGSNQDDGPNNISLNVLSIRQCQALKL